MTRRQFLHRAAGTAAAIAFPTIIPASALGRDGRVAPSNRVAMGFIGLGGQGTRNLQQFVQIPEVQIVALCDVDHGIGRYDNLYQFRGSTDAGRAAAKSRAVEWLAEAGRPVGQNDIASYGDFRELLARPDIDAVTVCTPDHWHGLISILAAKSGKDIYCEKPLVNSIPEGRAVCEAVRRYGRVLQTGSHERSNDTVRYTWELVRNGRIGKLHTMRVNMPNTDPHHLKLLENRGPKPTMPVPEGFDYEMWLGPAEYAPYTHERTHFWWRYILATGGGEITDRGAHIIDLGQFVNGCDDSGPVELTAKGKTLGDGLFDSFITYDFEATYANGVKMFGGSEGDRGIKFEGDKGWIFVHIHGGRLEASSPDLLREKIGPSELHTPRSPGHHRDFIECVQSRRRPIAHEEIGHRTAAFCHLINIALLTGRKVHWDPGAERITNDEHLDRLVAKPMRSPWKL
jgi:predicted dehydrogenase